MKFKRVKDRWEKPFNHVIIADNEYFLHQRAVCNFLVGNTDVWERHKHKWNLAEPK